MSSIARSVRSRSVPRPKERVVFLSDSDFDDVDDSKVPSLSQLSVEATSSQVLCVSDANRLAAAHFDKLGIGHPSTVVSARRQKGTHVKGLLKKGKGKGKGKNKGERENRADLKFPKIVPLMMVQFLQTLPTTVLSSSAVAATFTATYFTFSLIDQYASLALVFDQYKINLIETEWLPRVNVISTLGNTPGVFRAVVDFDDVTVLSTVNAASDYENCISIEAYKSCKHTFVPHIAVAAYQGTFAGYLNETSPWIDSSTPNVQHYGVKTAWDITSVATNIDQISRLWITLKNVR